MLNEQVGAAVEVGTLDVNEKPVEEFEASVIIPPLQNCSLISISIAAPQKSPLGQVELSIHLTERLLLTKPVRRGL